MLPKKGKKFPKRDGKGVATVNYAGVVAIALRTELGDTHQATKMVMRWTGASERTAKNWLSGTRGPSGEHLVGLVRMSDAVLEAVLRLAERQSSSRILDLFDARARLREIVQKFDELLEPLT